ncbi:hypothetical protein [Bacteriovorax sp. Seq25_V]|uniref:hypothetical protein n=1 Tax=Bacteriovorax sp. Seq25_V TaxID=1201288 RepID=UPI000389EE50|nr:hypothetical protein [Bacteriovorax sp. Seq25_V]EQC46600.1 putative lipoprotein [Bacteriovorax sp. Seq25_V]
MKKLLLITTAFALVSCGSSEKKAEEPTPRQFAKDYTLLDASSGLVPEWIENPTKGDKSSEIKKNRYFVNESSNVQKRLCVRSAEARATARIAQEIAQFMKNSYAEATQNGDDEVNEYMQEQLATEAQAFVVGSSVLKTYWEKRAYKEALGAEEDKTEYNCFALVKMSKKNLEKAVISARKKLVEGIESPEVKKKTDVALADVAAKFTELDKKVEVESSEE